MHSYILTPYICKYAAYADKGVPGLDYWMEYEQHCCKVNSVKDFHTKDSIPYHLA